MQKTNSLPHLILTLIYSVFIILLFLSLGSDTAPMIRLRVYVGLSLGVPVLLLLFKRDIKLQVNLPILMLGLFVCFQCVRVIVHSDFFAPDVLSNELLSTFYRQSMLRWGFAALIFYLSLIGFNRRIYFWRIMGVYSAAGFFLAMNALPALYKFGRAFYDLNQYKAVFFYPVFYKISFLGESVFGKFAHPNYTGDVIAMGFFSGLAGVLYLFMCLGDDTGSNHSPLEQNGRGLRVAVILMYSIVCFVLATAIFLLNSRGTMLSLMIACLLYLVGFCIKFPSRKSVLFAFGFLICGVLFLAWKGNLQKAWFELLTLRNESVIEHSEEISSFTTNIVGGKRAFRMFQDYPLWGVGTGGFHQFSRNYGDSEENTSFFLANHHAMNHYLQKLAEEGLGAILYFLFLIFYFIEAVLRCFRTKSRYQFFFGYAFVVAAFMLYLHAAFNHLLEHYTFILLAFSTMGLGLSLLQSNFKHH